MIPVDIRGIVIIIFFLSCAPIQRRDIHPESEKAVETSEIPDTMNKTQVLKKPAYKDGWIKEELVNLRNAPTKSSQILAQLSLGAKIRLVELVEEVEPINHKDSELWWRAIIENRTGYVYVHSSLVSLEEVKCWHLLDGVNFDSTSLEILGKIYQTELKLNVSMTYAGPNWQLKGEVDIYVYEGEKPRKRFNGMSFERITVDAEEDTIPLYLGAILFRSYAKYNYVMKLFERKNYELIRKNRNYWGEEWGREYFDSDVELYLRLAGDDKGTDIHYSRYSR